MPALYAAALGLTSYNFFFTAPYFTLTVYDRADVLTLLFFVLVALLTGNLAGRVRSQFRALRESATRTDILYKFSRTVADATGVDEISSVIAGYFASTFNRPAFVFLASPDCTETPMLSANAPLGAVPSVETRVAVGHAWRARNHSSRAFGYEFGPSGCLAALKAGDATIGVVIVQGLADSMLSIDQRRLVTAQICRPGSSRTRPQAGRRASGKVG